MSRRNEKFCKPCKKYVKSNRYIEHLENHLDDSYSEPEEPEEVVIKKTPVRTVRTVKTVAPAKSGPNIMTILSWLWYIIKIVLVVITAVSLLVGLFSLFFTALFALKDLGFSITGFFSGIFSFFASAWSFISSLFTSKSRNPIDMLKATTEAQAVHGVADLVKDLKMLTLESCAKTIATHKGSSKLKDGHCESALPFFTALQSHYEKHIKELAESGVIDFNDYLVDVSKDIVKCQDLLKGKFVQIEADITSKDVNLHKIVDDTLISCKLSPSSQADPKRLRSERDSKYTRDEEYGKKRRQGHH